MFVPKPSSSKVAEKLKILNDRMVSVLIQIDYLKNQLQSENNIFTRICTDPNYEPGLKLLNKKYPNIDIKANKSAFEHLSSISQKMLTELSFHYYTLVDVLEIKDNLMDLFGQISAFQYTLDIFWSFDITRYYLDLIANYSSIMIILSNITQIKNILLLFNFATLSKFDQDEPHYHRLCERLIEKHKDNTSVISEIHHELNPYSKTILAAVNSLLNVVIMKQQSIIDWDTKKIFQLSQNARPPNLLEMNPTILIPYSQIERWVIFGYLSVYPEITKFPNSLQLWRNVLSFSFSIVLFRSENLQIHPFLIKYFEQQKGFGKLAGIIKEVSKEFTNSTTSFHRSRRNYLRMAMRYQLQFISDFPGIMAPNIMTICQTISQAVDELHWLVKHNELFPSKRYTSIKADDFIDQLLPEFIYQIEELKYLLQQFDVMDNYYRIVLKSIDLPVLRKHINSLMQFISDDDAEILCYFTEKIENIDQPIESENGLSTDMDLKSFRDVRLDWFRLQTFLSNINSKFPWQQNVPFINFMNSMILHTNFVDNLENFLDKISSLQFLCFHRSKLNEWFEMNLKITAQHRYATIFPRLCGYFINNCQPSCPEDFNEILRSSIEMGHAFLSRICQELCKLLAEMVKSHFDLNSLTQPTSAVDYYRSHLSRKSKDEATGHGKNDNKIVLSPLPGVESKPKDITVSSKFDMELMALNQLATGLNSRPIYINNRPLQPSQYLKKELTKFLTEKFLSLSRIRIRRDKGEPMEGIRRPSEMQLIIEECMNLVTKIGEFVNVNAPRLFIDVFLRTSLTREILGIDTLTDVYCNWYIDFVLKQPCILHTPLLKCFLTIPQTQKEIAAVKINVEEYTDIEELRALVKVVGPFGMKTLSEKIMKLIANNVTALRKFVIRNRSTLIELNVTNLDYSKIKKLLVNIQDVDEFCQQWKQMGILLAFKDLCREALSDVVKKSMPFLKSTVVDLQQDFDANPIDQLSSVSEHENPIYAQCRNQLEINELCQAFGLKTKVDSTLFNTMESIKQEQQQIQSGTVTNIDQMEDQTNELLIVATSYLLPRIVGSNFYHVEYEALDESAHCVAYAIKELMYVFFFKYGEVTLDDQIRKFIALTSSNLLRLGMEINSSNQINKDEAVLIHNRDSIYIFFDFVIQTLENISDDFYEECFPYALVRQAYHNVVKQSRHVMTKAAHPTELSSKAAIEACKVDNK